MIAAVNDSIFNSGEDDDGLLFHDQYPRQLKLTVTIGDKKEARSHYLPLRMEKDSESQQTRQITRGRAHYQYLL
jgi:hypothetical protein